MKKKQVKKTAQKSVVTPEPRIGKMLKASQCRCVYCGNSNVDYDNPEIGGGEASQSASCLDCERSWQEFYTLTKVI